MTRDRQAFHALSVVGRAPGLLAARPLREIRQQFDHRARLFKQRSVDVALLTGSRDAGAWHGKLLVAAPEVARARPTGRVLLLSHEPRVAPGVVRGVDLLSSTGLTVSSDVVPSMSLDGSRSPSMSLDGSRPPSMSLDGSRSPSMSLVGP